MRRLVSLLTVLALLFLAVALAPMASAFTWTLDASEDNDIATSTSTTPTIDSVALTDTTYLVAWGKQTANDLAVTRCTIGGACALSIANVDAETGTINMERVSTTGAVICFEDDGSDDPTMAKTTDGGVTWSQKAIDSGVGGSSCSVWPASSTKFGAAYADSVANDYGFRLSTNSGGTWGAEVTITTSVDVTSGGYAHLASSNLTNFVAITSDDGASELSSCVSENSGTSWTCSTLVTATAANARITYQAGAYWVVWRDTATNGVLAYKSTDGGYTWALLTPITSGITGRVDLWAYNTTHVMVSGGVTGNSVQKIAYSTDGGGTWTTETSFTDAAVGAGQGASTVTITPSSGVAIAAYQTDPSVGNVHFSAVTTSFAAATTLGFDSVATVSNLVGYDMDATGSRIMARDLSGDNVKIWGPTLGTPDADIPTNCDLSFMEDAVFSMYGGDFSAFLNCDAGGDPQYLSIRTSTGDEPDQNSDFNNCGHDTFSCTNNIELSSFDNPADSNIGILGQVQDFPINYGAREDSGGFGQNDNRFVAWGFATQPCVLNPGTDCPSPDVASQVGVAMFSNREGFDDVHQVRSVNYGIAQVEDYCLGLDGTSYYMAAVDAGQSTKVWPITFSILDGPGDLASRYLDATINTATTLGTLLNNAAGIACGGGQIGVATTGGRVSYLSRQGSEIWAITGVDVAARGISLTEEFYGPGAPSGVRGDTCTTADTGTGGCVQYMAYLDETGATDHIIIVNATDGGAQTTSIDLPTGNGAFVGLEMNRVGSTLCVFQVNEINCADITPATTVIPISNPPPPVPGDDDGNGTVFGQGPAALSEAFGLSDFGGNLFFAAITMAFTTGLSGFGAGRGRGFNVWGAIFGLVFGFVLAWALGFLSAGAVFVIVVLVAGASIIFGVRAVRSRS